MFEKTGQSTCNLKSRIVIGENRDAYKGNSAYVEITPFYEPEYWLDPLRRIEAVGTIDDLIQVIQKQAETPFVKNPMSLYRKQ